MNVDPETIIKWCGAGAALGTMFAGARPFVDRWFSHYIERADKEQAAKLERERAEREEGTLVLRTLQSSVVAQERVAGVLAQMSERIDAVVDRLDALMLHHGVNITRVSPVPPAVDVRATLTGLGTPGMPAAASGGAGGTAAGRGPTQAG